MSRTPAKRVQVGRDELPSTVELFPGSNTTPEPEIEMEANRESEQEVSAPGNGRDRGAAAKKEPKAPLPEETKPAPTLPKATRSAADYDLSDILADDSDEDYTDAIPVGVRITFKLPKSNFIRVRPGREHQILVNVIKLGEEDQRPGQMTSFVLSKQMVHYFRDELNYPVAKHTVREVCTMQGEIFSICIRPPRR